MKAVKVFWAGGSQAIRLPRAFRVNVKEVYLKRTREGILIMKRDPWEIFWEGIAKLKPDSFNWTREQPPIVIDDGGNKSPKRKEDPRKWPGSSRAR